METVFHCSIDDRLLEQSNLQTKVVSHPVRFVYCKIFILASTFLISEGKDLASSFDCKFIETSVGLNHNVDELLVGVLKQILIRQEVDETKVEQSLVLKVKYIY